MNPFSIVIVYQGGSFLDIGHVSEDARKARIEFLKVCNKYLDKTQSGVVHCVQLIQSGQVVSQKNIDLSGEWL